jgi:hypothetical protein
MDNLKLLFSNLGDPEYLRLLLHPLPIYGLMLGIIAFIAAFVFKERKMQVSALLLIMISAMAGLPLAEKHNNTGIPGEKFDAGHSEQFAVQRKTQEKAQWAYLAVAALAGVTLLMGAHKGKPGLIVGIATIGAGTSLVIFGMAMHSQAHRPNLAGTPGKIKKPVATQRQAVKSKSTAQIIEPRQP